MAPSTSPFLWAFLQLLSQRGPLSAQDIAAHHFPASTPELRADLASDIAEQLWEAFALGLVAVYQAERGAPDCFVLTKAGVEALHAVHTPAEEQGEDFTTDAGSGEDIVEGAVARHPGQGDDLTGRTQEPAAPIGAPGS